MTACYKRDPLLNPPARNILVKEYGFPELDPTPVAKQPKTGTMGSMRFSPDDFVCLFNTSSADPKHSIEYR
jgi:hypothetical protein